MAAIQVWMTMTINITQERPTLYPLDVTSFKVTISLPLSSVV